MPMLETLPPKEIARALCSAGSGTATQTTAAPLSADTAQEVSALLLDVCITEQAQRNRRWLIRTLLSSLLFAVATAVGIAWWMWVSTGEAPTHSWTLVLPALFSGLTFNLLINFQPPAGKQQQSAAVALAKVAPDDPGTLAALLDTLPCYPAKLITTYLPDWDKEYGQTLRRITGLLWNAGSDLPLVLSEARRDRLRGTCLSLWRQEKYFRAEQVDFCAAVIKAMALIGDTKSRRLLERIAKAKRPVGNRAFLSALAHDCLPLLQEKHQHNEAARKVLRQVLQGKGDALDMQAIDVWIAHNDPGTARSCLQSYLHSLFVRRIVIQKGGRLAQLAICFLGVLLVSRVFEARGMPIVGSLTVGILIAVFLTKTEPLRQRFVELPEEGIAYILGKLSATDLLPELLDLVSTSRSQPSLDLMGRSKAQPLRNATNDLVFRLCPGSSIRFAPRHRAFLRTILWRHVFAGRKKTPLLSAAVFALGMLDDVSAKPLLSRIVQQQGQRYLSLRDKALGALRRINDIEQWRRSIKDVSSGRGDKDRR